ncbi:unnamed protein product, partial [Vitis vinifera]|uniref:Uncharacterized protein n=1 Tax=Vitis vinifera TaxID=29760 RepID=D7TKN1_VITVI
MPDDRGERIENSTSATLGVHLTYGLTMASYRPHIWSGANYPVFTIYKVISLKCLICFLLLVDETMIFSNIFQHFYEVHSNLNKCGNHSLMVEADEKHLYLDREQVKTCQN